MEYNKIMLKKTRTILFSVCLILFICLAPTIVLYSQGYRIDFTSKKLTQTGGLFLKIEPKQTEIFIDDKLKKKTDFFFGSALIENLLPKKYKIQIKKDGYYSWQKDLEIKEKEVTEVKNIILIPESPNFHILTNRVKEFWFTPDGKNIILKEYTLSPINNKNSWSLKLYNLENSLKSHLISEEDISSGEVDLLDLEFPSNSKEISLKIGAKEQLKFFSLEINKTPPVLTEIKQVLTSSENIITSKTVNQDVYYLDNLGFVFKNEERLNSNENPFLVKPETKYVLEIFKNFLFLRENKTLYQFNPDLKAFEKFFEGIKDLKISPDNGKIIYFSNNEIWILFLENISSQPKRKAGEKLFLIRLSEEIKDCFWLNSNYLIFNVENKLKIVEIDDRDRINIIEIAEFKNPEMFWNQFDKKLYLLSEENIYQSEKLLF